MRDAAPAYVEFASVDSIRHFARAYGDDNPLYSDPDYARQSVVGALCAPPLFPLATGVPVAPDPEAAPPLSIEALLGASHQTIGEERWVLRARIPEGTRLERTKILGD